VIPCSVVQEVPASTGCVRQPPAPSHMEAWQSVDVQLANAVALHDPPLHVGEMAHRSSDVHMVPSTLVMQMPVAGSHPPVRQGPRHDDVGVPGMHVRLEQ